MTVSSKHAKCNQVPSIISGAYSSSFYSTINFGSNHSGSSLHLNITNDVSSASLDKDRVSYFTCLFDGLISSHHIVSATALIHRTARPSISAMSSLLGISPKCVQLVMIWFRSHVAAPHIQCLFSW